MRLLMVGDIVGRPGRNCARDLLPKIKENYKVDFVIANGENAAGGLGINRKTADELFNYEIDVLTMGNHVWDKKEIYNFVDSEERLLVPANYPPGTPGKGYKVYEKNGVKIGVINLSGRVFMEELDCPFRAADEIIKSIAHKTEMIFLDFHAEATSEKLALAYYLDGRISALIGTHTHVQTADERIFTNGLAYLTDVGMTGPIESILGMEHESIVKKFLTKLPCRFEVAGGDVQLNAAVIDIDEKSGKSTNIERIFETHNF
ncbi:TIGR00282 family metallophosphoesterase [Natranaerofaba carboxydovora]|uniref:TIGR00282 family metallophosphoesterase n=1 Tax=Natranaerofaba carboxydovora TaxID=2742683 RepID=UPI001F1317AE|nr:TIGR00282 family metallophosphoesterase [Natranaerofaba carboxydovora]UMZ73480.1 YmdB-like protein [Natranaerofaba carboxydovora]